MADADAFAESLRAMSRFLVGEADLADTLNRVAELAVRSVGMASFAGITLMTEGGPRTSVFTDPASPEIDQAQYETGSGPCVDSIRDGKAYRIDSTADDMRWRAFSDQCLVHGILSTLSVPLLIGEDAEPIGALNFYSAARGGFDDDAQRRAEAFADQAAVVLSNAKAFWGAFELSEQLQTAMANRAVIEQAKGILMARESCGAEEAFDILRRASQRTNVKLRDVAGEIVRRTEGHKP